MVPCGLYEQWIAGHGNDVWANFAVASLLVYVECYPRVWHGGHGIAVEFICLYAYFCVRYLVEWFSPESPNLVQYDEPEVPWCCCDFGCQDHRDRKCVACVCQSCYGCVFYGHWMFHAKWKNRSELAVVRQNQKFSPDADPLPGARDGQNLISWRWSLPLPTNPVWWGLMHAISSYRGNRPTNKHSHKPTDRTDWNTLHRSVASAQCNKNRSKHIVTPKSARAVIQST